MRGLTEIALLPYDPGSTTDTGVILDDHSPRRLRAGLEGELTELYQPAKYYGLNSTEGYVRALVRSENGAEHARLLEVTTTPDGVSYQVSPSGRATNSTSSPSATISRPWQCCGTSTAPASYRSSSTPTTRCTTPIPLPGMVASELSISAGGSMLAMTVEGPSTPPTVELVDPRTREWEPVDREPSSGPVSAEPTLETITARDGLEFSGWLFRPPAGSSRSARCCSCTAGPRARVSPGYNEFFPGCWRRASPSSCPNVRGSGGFGRSFMHADDRERRFAAIDDVADAALFLVDHDLAPANRIACCGWSYGGYLTQAALTFHPTAVRGGHQHLRDERSEHLVPQHRAVDRGGGIPEVRPPGQRSRSARTTVAAAARARVTAPLLLSTASTTPTCRPANRSRCATRCARSAAPSELLLFDDDGHEIDKRENRAVLVKAMSDWLTAGFRRLAAS